MKSGTIAIILFLVLTGFSDKPAYRLFDGQGELVSYQAMVTACQGADVVLFGELHNDAMVHWIQQQLTKDMLAMDQPLVVGAEMFETDDQLLLAEWFADQIREKDFESEAKLWDNYRTDYRPILRLAKDAGISFIGTNVPRRYAAMVSRKGVLVLDSLSEDAKALLPPLPIAIDYTLPGYQAMIDMMSGPHGGGMDPRHFVEAQALKDATMAHCILEGLPQGGAFLHFNGTYHSKNFEGISWYLREASPDLNIVTIHSVAQSSLDSLAKEHHGLANFLLVVPDDMTSSY